MKQSRLKLEAQKVDSTNIPHPIDVKTKGDPDRFFSEFFCYPNLSTCQLNPQLPSGDNWECRFSLYGTKSTRVKSQRSKSQAVTWMFGFHIAKNIQTFPNTQVFDNKQSKQPEAILCARSNTVCVCDCEHATQDCYPPGPGPNSCR